MSEASNMVSHELDCHFTWNLENTLEDENYSDGWKNKIPFLLKKIEMNPEEKTRYLIQLAYFYVQEEENNLDKSLECLNEAIDLCDKKFEQHPEFEGYKVIALRNKIKILNLKGETLIETDKVYKELEKLQTFSSSTMAGMYGLKGHTMKLYFAKERVNEGIRCFQEAIELDEANYKWYVEKGKLLARLRWLTENYGDSVLPTEIENLFLKAVQLTHRKNALALVLLADHYMAQVKKNHGRFNNASDYRKPETLYLEAYELSPNDPRILKQCGDSFFKMEKVDFAEKCLLKAAALDPNDPIINHRLGRLYHYRKANKDLEKAEKYLVKAVSGECKDLFADIHLAKLRKQKNASYDILGHLKGCRKYVHWPRAKEVLEDVIRKFEMEG